VGLYLAVLDRWALRQRARRSTPLSEPLCEGMPKGDVVGAGSSGKHPQRTFVALAVIVAAIACLQIVIGVPEGLAGARTDHTNQILSGRVEANFDRYPGGFARSVLSPYYPIALRQVVEVAQQRHLSLFATGAAAKYRAEGLIADTSPLRTHISLPMSGTVLKGEEILSATASDYFVTKVEFEINGGPGRSQVISAGPYQFGWIALWRTTAVPNGTYLLQSIAYTPAGRIAHSASVSVVVKNE
jgi:hypothetical protein